MISTGCLAYDLGDEAAWRYVEFYTANIRNPHKRRACARFFAWCDDRGLTPAAIRPHDVAIYIEQLQHDVSTWSAVVAVETIWRSVE
jgi:hypothetical protein